MTLPTLENVVTGLNYGELPETWRVPEDTRFSVEKTLYDYQTDALQKAARALFLYYGKEHKWAFEEPQNVSNQRKQSFSGLYPDSIPDLQKYERPIDQGNDNQNQVFQILSQHINPQCDSIPYHNLINRMCFWMATGSGKTLVMFNTDKNPLQQYKKYWSKCPGDIFKRP